MTVGVARTPGRDLGFLWGAVSLALIALSPLASRVAPHLPGCLFKFVTGVPCPGCGSTRATLALTSLDLGGALAWNPLFTVGAIGLVAGGFVALGLALAGRGVPELRATPVPLRVGLALAVVGNWAWVVARGN